MVAALRERSWEGDDVLADQLEAWLGSGVVRDLRPLPVDLDELAGILEGDPVYGGRRIDLAGGEVWPAPADYKDMELFIAMVRDPGRADRLEIAISGRGTFRRFRDVLARWPGRSPTSPALGCEN